MATPSLRLFRLGQHLLSAEPVSQHQFPDRIVLDDNCQATFNTYVNVLFMWKTPKIKSQEDWKDMATSSQLSLEHVVRDKYPIFAYTLERNPDNHNLLELHSPGSAPPELTFGEVSDFCPTEEGVINGSLSDWPLKEMLVDGPAFFTDGRYRLIYMKLTWVHDEADPDAGSYVILNFTGVHHLCDGGTVLPFISEWATTCRNLCDKGRLQSSENVYTMDVTVLRGRRAAEPLPAPLARRMFIPVEAVLGAPNPDFPTVTARVNFPNSDLEQMQKDLGNVVTESGKALSKNDVMHAIVWHKMIETFGPQVTHDGKHSTIFFPADMRGRYPGLGRNHVGDATSINAVEVEAETVTLQECAQKFHDESRSGASVEYFREQLDFEAFEASRKPESSMASPRVALITTSVRHGAIYEGRFGGKMGSEGPINFSFVRPSLVVIPPYRRPNPTEEQKDWESGNDMQITIPLGQDEKAAEKYVASLPKGTRLLSIWTMHP